MAKDADRLEIPSTWEINSWYMTSKSSFSQFTKKKKPFFLVILYFSVKQCCVKLILKPKVLMKSKYSSFVAGIDRKWDFYFHVRNTLWRLDY